MNIFEFRDRLIGDYASYIESFIQIRDPHIHDFVERQLQKGMLWPDPLIQLNPLFAPGETIDELVARGTLHRECARIFRKDKTESDQGRPLRLHKHQFGEKPRLYRSHRRLCAAPRQRQGHTGYCCLPDERAGE